MPYVKEKFFISKPTLAFKFLMEEFNLSLKEAQKWVDRFRLFRNEQPLLEKNARLTGLVEVVIYKPESRGLRPSFEEEDFAIYDKPSGILVHPTSRECEYCLYDEILTDFNANAHIAHRLDRQTSGLILVAKHKNAEVKLKTLFEKRQVQKSYLAMVKGEIKEPICIDAALKNNDNFESIKLRMLISDDGKPSQTDVKPVKYFPDIDATLVHVFPHTGRQHQIRVHLFHVKHPIIGDTLYGVSMELAKSYLDKQIAAENLAKYFGASRLLLHAQSLEFEYDGKLYKFQSQKDIATEFYELAKEGKNAKNHL